jgi:flagellar protein FliS
MNRSSVYKEISISTSSPTNLVVLLYQGALRFLREAVDDINRQDYVHKRQSIDRAAAIVNYLQVTLDTEKGQEIAKELNKHGIELDNRFNCYSESDFDNNIHSYRNRC